MDHLTKSGRSRVMKGIRSSNTKPEVWIRKALHARGFRFRLHAGRLPGRPDLVLAKYNAAVFVHGCFWHQHGCKHTKWPRSNSSYWTPKLLRNMRRDDEALAALAEGGFRTAVIWECALLRDDKNSVGRTIDRLERWLTGERRHLEIGDHRVRANQRMHRHKLTR